MKELRYTIFIAAFLMLILSKLDGFPLDVVWLAVSVVCFLLVIYAWIDDWRKPK